MSNGKQKITMAARQRLGFAMRMTRQRAGKTLADMAAGHGFTGSALASWEQAKYLMERPSRRRIDEAMGWPEGTAQKFLEGKLRTLDELHGESDRRDGAYVPDILPEDDFSPEYDADPEDRPAPTPSAEEARKALAILLNAQMEAPNPELTAFTIEVQMPIYWDRDRVSRVAEAARKLAQQAIDAYVAQQL